MSMEYKGTLNSAKEFAAAGRLEEWVHLYLHAEGDNVPFSDGLKKVPRCFFGLARMPVALLTRICGPEEGMRWPVEAGGFERIVSELMEAMREGRDVPPMIVKYEAGAFELNDGNHRHEACRRLGIEAYPTIIWITEAVDRDDFFVRYGEYLL